MKYVQEGFSITTTIKNDTYIVRAFMLKPDKTQNKYIIKLELAERTTEMFVPLYMDKPIELESNSINGYVTDYIGKLESNGFFGQFITHYEYILKCFDAGNHIYEEEAPER